MSNPDFYRFDQGGAPVTQDHPLPVSVAGSGTGALANQVQGNSAAGAADTGNPVKIGARYNSTLVTLADGQRGDVQLSSRGEILFCLSQGGTTAPVASPTDGQTVANGLATRSQAQVFNGASWDREKKPSLTSRIVSSAATTNATSAKTSAGDLFLINGSNTNAAKRYLKLYNKASAPTVGTDTPVMTLVLPASSSFSFNMPTPMYFSTGIAYAITTGAADADTGAVGVGDIEGLNLGYA